MGQYHYGAPILFMKFYRSIFHWNPKRIWSSEEELTWAAEILNQLSPEQIKAVELYGKSRYEEGFDYGKQENS